MIIEWKLDHPKYCDKCPCFDGYITCRLFGIKNMNIDNKGKTKRPFKCLSKNSI